MSDNYDPGHGVKDAALRQTKTLPAGAATVYSTAIDLGALSYLGSRLAPMTGKVTGPAVNTTQLPDAQTLKYTVQHSDDNVTFTDLYADVLTQTGAGGAGAAEASAKHAIPVDCKRYVRIKCVKSGAGDASASSLTHELLF